MYTKGVRRATFRKVIPKVLEKPYLLKHTFHNVHTENPKSHTCSNHIPECHDYCMKSHKCSAHSEEGPNRVYEEP